MLMNHAIAQLFLSHQRRGSGRRSKNPSGTKIFTDSYMQTFVEHIPHVDIDVLRDHWRSGCEQIYVGSDPVGFAMLDDDKRVLQECRIEFPDCTVHVELVQRRAGLGLRYMFICPRCGRSCRKLYKWGWLGCRECHGLRYASAGLSNARSALLVLTRLEYRTGAELGEPRRRKGQRTRHFRNKVQRMSPLARRATKARGFPNGALLRLE